MTYSTERRIEFRDTDAAGIVHFSAFFPMMESAEHEMLRSLGISVMPRHGRESETAVTWPRVAARCDYRSAARFEDILKITVQVARMGTSSVEYQFKFTRDDELIAEGSITVVCCRVPGIPGVLPNGGTAHKGLEKVAIPDSIRDLLSKHS